MRPAEIEADALRMVPAMQSGQGSPESHPAEWPSLPMILSHPQ